VTETELKTKVFWSAFHKSALGRARLHSLRENSILQLILVGAAVHRCGQ
jgi:isochorismate hydrolase